MSQTVANDSSRLELDKVLQYAVTLAWQDFAKPTEPRSIRVEYLCEPGCPLDHLSVWSTRAGGYQDLVCDFWTSASLAHPAGACFEDRYHSEAFAQALLFVMKHQGLFARPADAGRHGLVLIHPPEAEDHKEAASWLRGIQAFGMEASPEDHERPGSQTQHQEENAWKTAEQDASLPKPDTGVFDESVEVLAKTHASNHFEFRDAWPE